MDNNLKENNMKYLLEIKPAIEVDKRHQLQDALKKLGYHIIGGGQMMDFSSCDISFESPENEPIKGA